MATRIKKNINLICSECDTTEDVILYDMSNHYLYDWDDDAIPLCTNCQERIWDQV